MKAIGLCKNWFKRRFSVTRFSVESVEIYGIVSDAKNMMVKVELKDEEGRSLSLRFNQSEARWVGKKMAEDARILERWTGIQSSEPTKNPSSYLERL
jgi:hypothetical protein